MATMADHNKQSLESMIQIFEECKSQGIKLSPHLTAIQALNGRTPGEKYKGLNAIINNIASHKHEISFENLNEDIPEVMIPLVLIRVGNLIKSKDAVLEALKSEDKSIVHQALLAKWFFEPNHEHMNVDFFTSNVMPHVSSYTRFKIIKMLSRTLIGSEIKAEKFFTRVVDLYNLNEAMPLLPACSKNFILNTIQKHDIILKDNMLLTFYKKHPDLVILYLKSEHKNCSFCKIQIHKQFLPYLIRHHIDVFIELYESHCELIKLKLGKTITALFFKQAVNAIIEKPIVYLKIWSLKTICRKLTTEQFEKMYSNLFPKDVKYFRLQVMINYLKHYPKDKRLNLLMCQYRSKYSVDLITNIESITYEELKAIHDLISVELFEALFIKIFPSNINNFNVTSVIINSGMYSPEKKLKLLTDTFKTKYNEDLFEDVNRIKSDVLLELLSIEERVVQAKRIIETCKVNSSSCYEWYCFMPVKDSFPIFQEVIKKSSVANTRCEFIKYMLRSCKYSKRKEDLFSVINYYNMRHKNERIEVLNDILDYIRLTFDLKNLDDAHWKLLKEILQRVNIKNELSKLPAHVIEFFFNSALYYSKIECNAINNEIMDVDVDFIDTIYSMIIDYNLQSRTPKWIYLRDYPDIQRDILNKLLTLLIIKYPKDHSIWKVKNNISIKMTLALSCLKSIIEFNNNLNQNVQYLEKNNLEKLAFSNCEWLVDLTKELVAAPEVNYYSMHEFKKLLKHHDRKTYNSLCVINSEQDEIPISNIKSGDAWIKLKKNQDDVIAQWEKYLAECKNRLKYNSKLGALAARRFLLAAKWYADLPVKFFERCLSEIKDDGSIKVLSILVEGEVFGKLITSFAPREKLVDSFDVDAKEYYQIVKSILPAMNLTNPPVPYDTIVQFCVGDYVLLATQALTFTSQRVSKAKIMKFAEDLIRNSVSIKKHGIRLIFKEGNQSELLLFVKRILETEQNVSIREIIANLIYKRFLNKPNDYSFELIDNCIESICATDTPSLNILCKVYSIQNKYAPRYVFKLLNRIENIYESNLELKEEYTIMILNEISSLAIQFFSEEEILQLLEKYYFETNSLKLSAATQNFAKTVFCQPYTHKTELD